MIWVLTRPQVATGWYIIENVDQSRPILCQSRIERTQPYGILGPYTTETQAQNEMGLLLEAGGWGLKVVYREKIPPEYFIELGMKERVAGITVSQRLRLATTTQEGYIGPIAELWRAYEIVTAIQQRMTLTEFERRHPQRTALAIS